jgi:4-amino-4-deoxy-L-arabinose transferase-like glycosyltransferase
MSSAGALARELRGLSCVLLHRTFALLTNRPLAACALIAKLAFLLALAFVILIYPLTGSSAGAVLDPDDYGPLGFGVWKSGTLSYYPGTDPSIFRGPLYPTLMAAALAVSGGAWPTGIQIVQALLFAGTGLLVFQIARTLWNTRVALLAQLTTAMHPLLIWYTSRIWIETLLAFLFTAVVAAFVAVAQKPTTLRVAVAGVLLGVSALGKSIFVPLFITVPLLLIWLRAVPVRSAVAVGIIAAGVVCPWTIRNYRLTGTFIAVHSGVGAPLSEGDTRIMYLSQSPLGFERLFEIHRERLNKILDASEELQQATPRWRFEMTHDRVLLRESLKLYASEPLFLLKKIALNGVLFWVHSQTPTKTLILIVLQLPLLIFGGIQAFRMRRRRDIRSAVLLLVAFVFAVHLPIEAQARYSAALIPVLLPFAVSIIEPAGAAAPRRAALAARA